MDSRYVPLYKQAAAIQHQFHDYSHPAANTPAAVVFRNQLNGLTHDIAAGKDPRTVEHRIKTIQNQLHLAQTMHSSALTGQPQILNPHQTALMHKNFANMQQSIRMHPHY
jgi:hypothetical protein